MEYKEGRFRSGEKGPSSRMEAFAAGLEKDNPDERERTEVPRGGIYQEMELHGFDIILRRQNYLRI